MSIFRNSKLFLSLNLKQKKVLFLLNVAKKCYNKKASQTVKGEGSILDLV